MDIRMDGAESRDIRLERKKNKDDFEVHKNVHAYFFPF